MSVSQEFKGGFIEACNVVKKELLRLENIGKITGDPNTYWKIESVRRVETLLTERLEELSVSNEIEEPTQEE